MMIIIQHGHSYLATVGVIISIVAVYVRTADGEARAGRGGRRARGGGRGERRRGDQILLLEAEIRGRAVRVVVVVVVDGVCAVVMAEHAATVVRVYIVCLSSIQESTKYSKRFLRKEFCDFEI